MPYISARVCRPFSITPLRSLVVAKLATPPAQAWYVVLKTLRSLRSLRENLIIVFFSHAEYLKLDLLWLDERTRIINLKPETRNPKLPLYIYYIIRCTLLISVIIVLFTLFFLVFLKKSFLFLCRFAEKSYLCTRKTGTTPTYWRSWFSYANKERVL